MEEIQLANKYEALTWICKNQLGRRNLSPERKKFLLGKEYESTKLAVGAPLGSKHGIRKCGQNDHIFTESRTCQRIASEHGVGEKTVRRAEKYSRGIDAAEEAVPGAQEEILTGHIKATDEQIVALASIPKEERPAILEELKKKKSDRDDTVLEREQATTEAKACTAEEKANGNGKQHGVAGRTAGNVGTGTDHRVPAGRGN